MISYIYAGEYYIQYIVHTTYGLIRLPRTGAEPGLSAPWMCVPGPVDINVQYSVLSVHDEYVRAHLPTFRYVTTTTLAKTWCDRSWLVGDS